MDLARPCFVDELFGENYMVTFNDLRPISDLTLDELDELKGNLKSQMAKVDAEIAKRMFRDRD